MTASFFPRMACLSWQKSMPEGALVGVSAGITQKNEIAAKRVRRFVRQRRFRRDKIEITFRYRFSSFRDTAV